MGQFSQATRIATIYLLRNRLTGQVYVGSSVHTYFRWNRHIRELDRKVHPNPKLQASWNKYGGLRAFEFQIVEVHEAPVDVKHLRARESAFIEQLKALTEGFNISRDTEAPMTGRHHSAKTRAQMAVSHTGVFPGAKTRQKIGDGNRKRVWSQTARDKIAAVRRAEKGKRKWKKPMSAAGRENCRQAALRRGVISIYYKPSYKT